MHLGVSAVATLTGPAVSELLSISMLSSSRSGAASMPAREPSSEPRALWPLRDADYVARLLGIPRKSVLQYAREGKLPCVRIGRHVRFVLADVQAAIDAQRPSSRRD